MPRRALICCPEQVLTVKQLNTMLGLHMSFGAEFTDMQLDAVPGSDVSLEFGSLTSS